MIKTWISVQMGPDCLQTNNIFESLPQDFARGPWMSNTGLLCECWTATSFRMEGESLEWKETCFASHSPHIHSQMATPTGLDSLMKALEKKCSALHVTPRHGVDVLCSRIWVVFTAPTLRRANTSVKVNMEGLLENCASTNPDNLNVFQEHDD